MLASKFIFGNFRHQFAEMLRCLMLILLVCQISFGQDVSLYNQVNDRVDFTFVGNTLNLAENNSDPECHILTESSAALNLNPGDEILSAYLYWAGSGPGDTLVTLNGVDLAAERLFVVTQLSSKLPSFSAFVDVTKLVQAMGATTYTLSNLDLTNLIPIYCPNGTNFGGWAIVVIVKNDNLPYNQINIYDGLQRIPDDVTITLSALNVLDNNDAKIGFVAWEGDRDLTDGETLQFNGNILTNELNPPNNAFNGTNTITGSTSLYNMDLDIYSIENFLSIGNQSAEVKLTSRRDYVLINVVVTKLNNQLPDATVKIDSLEYICNPRQVIAKFTVANISAVNSLPANTNVAIYADNVLIGNFLTPNIIEIEESESFSILVDIPSIIPNDFILKISVDDNGFGVGSVIELLEDNNTDEQDVELIAGPELPPLTDLLSCNEGFSTATFNFSGYQNTLSGENNDQVFFYPSLLDFTNNTNVITNLSNYSPSITPTTIYAKVRRGLCSDRVSFNLRVVNCPPIIYNFISANNDGVNDVFFIDRLRNIFVNYKLEVYNRWGRLIWTGNNFTPEWDGIANRGERFDSAHVPDGTYFYILYLNDIDYPNPMSGYLFIKSF